MQCPQCGTKMYLSISGIDICPGCGYGSTSVAEATAQRQRQIDEGNRQMEAATAPRTIASGEWVLNIYYRLRGSKSEGQHGILFHSGELIEPHQVGEVIDTDLGQMRYYCRLEDMVMPWEPTGWNFADENKFLPSWAEASSEDSAG
jgi:hypothetical protein